jgi:hypothetical protein
MSEKTWVEDSIALVLPRFIPPSLGERADGLLGVIIDNHHQDDADGFFTEFIGGSLERIASGEMVSRRPRPQGEACGDSLPTANHVNPDT